METELKDALGRLIESQRLPSGVPQTFQLEEPRQADHGEFSTNYAMVNGKKVQALLAEATTDGASEFPPIKSPRDLAELLVAELLHPRGESQADSSLIVDAQVAGPGFINLTLRPQSVASQVGEILSRQEAYAHLPATGGSLNLEFVSVNPNGPITVGSGRGAAFGDTLARTMRAAGRNVTTEYYINDALNSEQMRLFTESVRAYLKELAGLPLALPEKGYQGEYVRAVAELIHRDGLADATTPVADLQVIAQELMIAVQRKDLADFGVEFDVWTSEMSLHNQHLVDQGIAKVKATGHADSKPYRDEVVHEGKNQSVVRTPQEPGALWLRSVPLGDEKDRVIVRANGRPAYIAGDIGYLEDKLGRRKFDEAKIILGPDHHGYIGRMNAVCQALGYEKSRFEIVIYQIVRFVKDGKTAVMRKRDGNIYELKDLVAEIGKDAARFFYTMRSPDTHMDFDLDLATKQTDENPVYYVQYAHARIASILDRAIAAGIEVIGWDGSYAQRLTHPAETRLVIRLEELREEIRRTAADYGVHRLATYAVDLARTFHTFYDQCRVISIDDPELSRARLCLCQATAISLRSVLGLLGVSAPTRMHREEVSE